MPKCAKRASGDSKRRAHAELALALPVGVADVDDEPLLAHDAACSQASRVSRPSVGVVSSPLMMDVEAEREAFLTVARRQLRGASAARVGKRPDVQRAEALGAARDLTRPGSPGPCGDGHTAPCSYAIAVTYIEIVSAA